MNEMDEIPQALRDKSTVQKAKLLSGRLILGSLLTVTAIIFTGAFFFRSSKPTEVIAETEKPVATPLETQPQPLEPTASETQPEPTPPPTVVDNILGHLEYELAPPEELKPITPDGRIKMRRVAAEKFLQMQAAAKAEGVILNPISGFRDLKEQEYLFFKLKEKRAEQATKRAEVSAPPGYSEHHTGYAIDIGDGLVPTANLSPNFEKTAAFRWLEKNASKYSFELSFPVDNPQGISYEPWHWRFVGDSHSLETFYKARSLPGK